MGGKPAAITRQHAADTELAADADALVLESFVPYRLSVLSNRISQRIADVYAERFGIGVTEWRVIAVLGRFPGLSAADVAERTAMDKVAVSRALARLLQRGLLLRDTADEDRRRSVLALSPAGRAVHAEVAPLALRIEARLLARLDAGERHHLQRLLDKLERGIPAIGED
ncbi:MAG: MarR family winged helix-turn-helix transcriptional regulator [Pseudoxanthomonas suwonensis]|nr:MarR family winged helix-turn-helix transcriptional regulator [Pseudoxanthomonas suwonensis]